MGHPPATEASATSNPSQKVETGSGPEALDDEGKALRTLLKHASIVRGKQGNLLILPSISLPSGELADARIAIARWLRKVQPAD